VIARGIAPNIKAFNAVRTAWTQSSERSAEAIAAFEAKATALGHAPPRTGARGGRPGDYHHRGGQGNSRFDSPGGQGNSRFDIPRTKKSVEARAGKGRNRVLAAKAASAPKVERVAREGEGRDAEGAKVASMAAIVAAREADG
jgi:hypothetical protein